MSLIELFERSSVSSVLSVDSGESLDIELFDRSRCFTLVKPDALEISLRPRPFASTFSASTAKLLPPRTISLLSSEWLIEQPESFFFSVATAASLRSALSFMLSFLRFLRL